MRARVKWVRIDRKHRKEGTYQHEVNEDTYEGLPVTDDLGEVGQAIHDDLYPGSNRWFVKVLGVEYLPDEEDEAEEG